MADLFHWYGNDLVAGPDGDLQTVEGTLKGEQAVVRRLLTVALTYIWEITYGGGLSQYVGLAAASSSLEGIIRAQLFLEPAVSQTPTPVINVTSITGGYNVVIQYVDAATGAPSVLNFNVTE